MIARVDFCHNGLENVTPAVSLDPSNPSDGLVASAEIKGPQSSLDLISDKIEESGMSQEQLDFIAAALKSKVDSMPDISGKITIKVAAVGAVIVTTTTIRQS